MPKLPDLTNLDFSGLDAGKLSGLDEKLVAAVRDAAYITIGFGVLAFQQAQVRRREIVQALADRFGTSRTQMDDVLSNMEAQLSKLDQRMEALDGKLDAAVDKIEERLPEQAAALVGQAHDLAKAARKQVRGLIRTAA
jgi:ABC-type transporter Mla subunit MlaD